MKLWVNYTQILEDSYQVDEEYGEWRRDYDYSVTSVVLSQPGNWDYDEFEVPFEVAEGDEVFVVYARYSDGDSFGTARGKGEIVEVFKDRQLANVCRGIIEQSPKLGVSISYPISETLIRKIQNMFRDYFVDLNLVDIKKFKIQK